MVVCNYVEDSNLVVTTNFFNVDLSQTSKTISDVIDNFEKRVNQPGQFLNWVGLPELQLTRIDEIYELVAQLKSGTNAKYLSVLGIGGSKHTVEHMLGINGLNIKKDTVLFLSDIDSVSLNRYMYKLDNDITKSNFLVASKSGSTFETKDGFLRVMNMLKQAYLEKGFSDSEASSLTSKHFIAVTDKNSEKSELRRISNSENWLGDLYIHDDVGGRFSALDDHSLFTLAYAGMSKEDMVIMLKAAQDVSKKSLLKDFSLNNAFQQAAFWSAVKLKGINSSVHQYMGSMFEDTVYWHAQMQNESVKDTSKQIAKVPDAMHHSAEAHFNPDNKYAFALTVPCDKGIARENAEGYIGALTKSYSNAGPYFCETVETLGLGLSPVAAGTLTQSRAFSTVYQELIEKTINGTDIPSVLDSVLQPHVEVYKKNLKPQAGEKDIVVAGRNS